jgi:hypothetical protein
MPPRAGVKPELRWRHDGVLRVLLQSYCLEPRFECWEELQRLSGKRPTQPAELTGFWGVWLTGGCMVVLLLCACGCTLRGREGVAAKSGRHKRDHVV